MRYNLAMSTNAQQCQRFCALLLSHPEMTNATARIGAWLLAVSGQTGLQSISLSYRQIRDGFEFGANTFRGIGSHIDTVKASVEWLEREGVISTSQGDPIGFGHYARVYTIII